MKRGGTLLIRIGELKVLLRRLFIFILFLAHLTVHFISGKINNKVEIREE